MVKKKTRKKKRRVTSLVDPACYLIFFSACDSNLAMSDLGSSFPLLAPAPIAQPDEIDLEAGPGEQFQCWICLESDAPHTPLGAHLSPSNSRSISFPICCFCDTAFSQSGFGFAGRELIAPCKCKGTSKYVHRECLDQWRAVKVSANCFCTFCAAF